MLNLFVSKTEIVGFFVCAFWSRLSVDALLKKKCATENSMRGGSHTTACVPLKYNPETKYALWSVMLSAFSACL